MRRDQVARVAAAAAMAIAAACSGGQPPPAPPAVRPSILLVTLDTTRADAVGPDARGIETPAFNAIAARGLRFRRAYATVPETLPSHASMMTGLYPAGHGIHENARFVPESQKLAAAQLKASGYRTAAFVSSFVLARRFGLARGFDVYDDELAAGTVERTSPETTDRALTYLASAPQQPLFVWVHYFDPHAPYAAAEPYRSTYAQKPYLGEVAAMDAQLGRLVAAFEQRVVALGGQPAVVIAGDHGEGLGDHGEAQHGNLLYDSTIHVPMAIVGPGVKPGVIEAAVSTRRIFHTLLDLAGIDSANSLRSDRREVVVAEAMKPFLEYGWQPQIAATEGTHKAIFAGRIEAYDLAADPAETRDLGSGANLPASLRKVLDEYPVPSPEAARPPEALSDEARRSLASLGYVSASAPPVVRRDAPRPVDMAPLFEVLDRASGLFVREQYGEVIPLLGKILAADPNNLDATLRLATAHSSLGHDALALEAFKKAAALAPRSPDVRTYLALHYARGKDWEKAVPLLDQVLAESPERLPALEAMAVIRERQDRLADAIALRQKIATLRAATPPELVKVGQMAMALQQTTVAIDAFERARAAEGRAFAHDLELGVLYLASRRFTDARDALDRVPPSHPEYPMALFKRAQVSVLLKESDSGARIARAREKADATTRVLIEREKLFLGVVR